MGKSRIAIPQIFTSHRSDLSATKLKQPLVISSPVGPVKNSRGPDFTRSQDFIIVNAIQDCGPVQRGDTIDEQNLTKSDKKLALGIFTKKTLLKTQSLASFAPSPKSTSRFSATPRRTNKDNEATNSPIPKPKNAPGSITATREDHTEIHTFQPTGAENLQRSERKFATKLPKSRTVNVLQDIKNSVPRRTDITTPVSNPVSKNSQSSLKQTEMPRIDFFRSLRRRSREESTPSSRHSSTTNVTTPDSASQILEQSERGSLPGQISRPQPSSYWSGRFTALRDRLSSEHMERVLSRATDTIQMGVWHHFNQRSVDAEPVGIPPYPLRDEDGICCEVFAFLESQCTTKSAKESLWCWQETYARRNRRPRLLPAVSGYQNESLVSRRFAAHARHQDRQGMAYLEDAYYSNASNAFTVTNPHSVEARYLNFR